MRALNFNNLNVNKLMLASILAISVLSIGCGERNSRTRIRKNMAKPNASAVQNEARTQDAKQGTLPGETLESVVDQKEAEATQADMEKLSQALDLEISNVTPVRPESFVEGKYELEELFVTYAFANDGVGTSRKVSLRGDSFLDLANPVKSKKLLQDTDGAISIQLPDQFSVENNINSPFRPDENMAGQKVFKSTYDNLKNEIQLSMAGAADTQTINLFRLLVGSSGSTSDNKSDVAFQSEQGNKILTLRALKSAAASTLQLMLVVDEKATAKNDEAGRSRTFVFKFKVTPKETTQMSSASEESGEQELASALGAVQQASGEKVELP